MHDPSYPKPIYRGKADATIVPRRQEVRLLNKGRPDELVSDTRGPSLNIDLRKLIQQFGTAREVLGIPDTLKIEQRGADPGHYEIMPSEPNLTFDEFVAECAKIALGRVLP